MYSRMSINNRVDFQINPFNPVLISKKTYWLYCETDNVNVHAYYVSKIYAYKQYKYPGSFSMEIELSPFLF